MCHAAGIPAEKTKLIKPVYDDNDLCKLLLEKLVDDKLGVGGVKMNFFINVFVLFKTRVCNA